MFQIDLQNELKDLKGATQTVCPGVTRQECKNRHNNSRQTYFLTQSNDTQVDVRSCLLVHYSYSGVFRYQLYSFTFRLSHYILENVIKISSFCSLDPYNNFELVLFVLFAHVRLHDTFILRCVIAYCVSISNTQSVLLCPFLKSLQVPVSNFKWARSLPICFQSEFFPKGTNNGVVLDQRAKKGRRNFGILDL